jgi:hypothetical protein
MTDPRLREILIEQAAGAWRPARADGGVGTLPAWHDLDEEGRVEAYQAARRSRALEAALDPDGLSSTCRAVLARIAGG